MATQIDMQAVSDRALGLTPPRIPASARLPRRWDSKTGVVLLTISALVTVTSLALWFAGDTGIALRLFGGTILALAVAIRLL